MATHEIPDPLPAWDGTARGPVTEAEVLVAHQRSYVLGWERRKSARSSTEFVLPTELPPPDAKRQMTAFRLDPACLPSGARGPR